MNVFYSLSGKRDMEIENKIQYHTWTWLYQCVLTYGHTEDLYRLIYTFKTDNEATVYDRFTWKTHLGLTLKISLMKLSNILYLAKLCTTATVKDLTKLFYLSN